MVVASATQLTRFASVRGVPHLLVWVLGCLHVGAQAAQEVLVANGGCRDGRPNGAFALRSPDGRLRVSGAFHEGKRTGTFIFWNAAGLRVAVIPYEEDVRNGTIALWQPGPRGGRDPTRRLEAPVVRGHAHGVTRAWDTDARLRYEATYAHDQLQRVLAWDASGKQLGDDAARAMANEAQRRDSAYIDGLEAMLARHRPSCNRPSPSGAAKEET